MRRSFLSEMTMMNTLIRLCRLPLHAEPMDAWLSKWGSVAVGLLVLALSAAVLPGRTSNPAELLLGIGMASVACSVLCLFGVLARRVHLAWHRGAAPWRTRIGEFVGLIIGLAVGGSGLRCLTTLPVDPAGLIIGALLVTSLAFAIICLGLCSTLSHAVSPRKWGGLRSERSVLMRRS
jgi:hypothetical protein